MSRERAGEGRLGAVGDPVDVGPSGMAAVLEAGESYGAARDEEPADELAINERSPSVCSLYKSQTLFEFDVIIIIIGPNDDTTSCSFFFNIPSNLK